MPKNCVYEFICVDEEGLTAYPEAAIEFKVTGWIGDEDLAYIATEAARWHYDKYDGWEYNPESYPLTYQIYVDGIYKGTFKVGMEYEPTFYLCNKVD